MRSKAWVGVAVAASMVLVSCGPEEPQEETGADHSGGSAAMAARFAPRVFLAEGEDLRPMDATRFIERSELKFDHEGVDCVERPVASPADPWRLSQSKGYRHQKARKDDDKLACGSLHEGRTYAPTEIGAGFYLDPPEEIRKGEEPRHVPVYWEHHRHGSDPERTAYVYWFFYAYNSLRLGNRHEGDWERVAVQLRDGRPEAVTFAKHGATPCSVEMSKLDPRDGHPTVYSARGSHGSYPRADTYWVNKVWKDRTSKGTEWNTWSQVRAVTEEPWWGYAGWWGARGRVDGFKGPMGPYPKRKLPGVFTDKRCEVSSDEQPTPPAGEQPAPKTKEAAIGRYEQYLHAIGRGDVDTICEVAGPAAKSAEEDGFGPCRVTIPVMLAMYSTEQKAALRTATVDPGGVSETAPGVFAIPASAVRASVTFAEHTLGTQTMEYLKDNWYVTDRD